MPARLIRLLTALWVLAVWHSVAAAETATHLAHRIVSLAPHITELVFAAGGGNKLVATVSSSDYPPSARSLPRVGDGLSVNTESLLALQPDLVIAWHATGAALALAPTLQRLSISLIYAQPHVLTDIPLTIRHLGDLVGTPATAQAAAQVLDQRIAALLDRYSKLTPVSVFIEIGNAPLYTIGKDSLLNDVLHTCGGVNIYADAVVAAPLVSTEDVLVRQPDVIITGGTDSLRLAARQAAWAKLNLQAAKHQHVYAIDSDALFRPGPRLIDAAEALCNYLDLARSDTV